MAKDKDRLYVTLNHRHDKPGYHWAIILAPSDKKASEDVKDTMKWDITNEEVPANHQWRFRASSINQYKNISLCSRLLLAKFDPSQRKSTLSSISAMLESINVKQNDPTFTCRVWVLNAIQVLEANGFIKLNTTHTDLEARIKAFGDECMQRIVSKQLDIAAGGIKAIPVLDLRK